MKKILKRIVQLLSTFIEIAELQIILECRKRQLTYLWALLNFEDQTKEILDIQLKE